MRRFQLFRDNIAVAEGVEFIDGRCSVQWFGAPPKWDLFDVVDQIWAECSGILLSWIDAAETITPDVECGCDFVQILGGHGHRIEVHHSIPDDGAGHVESLECGCSPRLFLRPPDILVAEHADQDADEDANEDVTQVVG